MTFGWGKRALQHRIRKIYRCLVLLYRRLWEFESSVTIRIGSTGWTYAGTLTRLRLAGKGGGRMVWGRGGPCRDLAGLV